MKKISIVAIMFIMALSVSANEPIEKMKASEIKLMTTEAKDTRIEVLNARLLEINSLNLNSLTKVEKRELRKEVRNIDKEVKQNYSGGIYISGAALLIIIILIILL